LGIVLKVSPEGHRDDVNECPMELVGLFCWASLLEKASFDSKKEVKRSHRSNPQ
jgi:hypothetical protein